MYRYTPINTHAFAHKQRDFLALHLEHIVTHLDAFLVHGFPLRRVVLSLGQVNENRRQVGLFGCNVVCIAGRLGRREAVSEGLQHIVVGLALLRLDHRLRIRQNTASCRFDVWLINATILVVFVVVVVVVQEQRARALHVDVR